MPPEEPRRTNGGATAAGAATGATATAASAGAIPAPVGAAVGTLAIRETTAAVLAGLRQFWGDGSDDILWLGAALRRRHPELNEDELRELLRREKDFGSEFRRRMEARLERDVPAALRSADPKAALRAVLDREKRYIAQRQKAMLSRSISTIERASLKRTSPQGAFWRLSPYVKEHTIDCIVMAGKFWPWEVLDVLHPPRHANCPCSLHGLDEAIASGLLPAAFVPSAPEDGIELAKDLQHRFSELREAIVRNGQVGEDELVRAVDAVEETRLLLEAPYAKRFAAGTVKGGQFMPKKGGFAALVKHDLSKALDNLLTLNRRGAGDRLVKPAAPRAQRAPAEPAGHVPGAGGPSAPKPAVAHDGLVPKDFEEFRGRVAAGAGELSERYHAKAGFKSVHLNKSEPDTTALRHWDGTIELGRDAEAAIADGAAAQEGKSDDRAAGMTYLAYSRAAHETAHAINPITPEDYADPAGFTLEEALAEEVGGREIAMEWLKADGHTDAMRWFARNPDHPRSIGAYTTERARLGAVLDEANVPLTERDELLRTMTWRQGHQARLNTLAALVGGAQGMTPKESEARVRSVLAGEHDEELGLMDAERHVPLLSPKVEDYRAPGKLDPGTSVRITTTGGDVTGEVTRAAYRDGEWRFEVAMFSEGGVFLGKKWPAQEDVAALHPPDRSLTGGDKVEGEVNEGDAVTLTNLDGSEFDATLRRVVGTPEAEGEWNAVAETTTGALVPIRSRNVADVAPRTAQEVPGEGGSDEDGSKPAIATPDSVPSAQTASEPDSGGKATPVPLKPVSGAQGFDARHYSDPRRSLLRKMRARKRGESVELADGTVITAGPKGSFRVTPPDAEGQGKLYSTPQRAVNAEIPAIMARHGLSSPPGKPTHRAKGDQADGPAAGSPPDSQKAPAAPDYVPPVKGPVAQEVLGDYKDTEDKHTVVIGGVGRVYSKERQQLHAEIIESFLNGKAKPDGKPKALFTAGAPGSGKSTILKSEGVETPPDAVDVNPDLVKEQLPEFKAMAQARDPYSGAGVHEESSALAKVIMEKAREQGLNVTIDGVGDSVTGKFKSKLEQLNNAGYDVEVVVAHLPLDEGRKRVAARAERSGRSVPADVVTDYYQTVPQRFFDDYAHLPWLKVGLYSTDVPRGEAALKIAGKDAGAEFLDVDRMDDLKAFEELGTMNPDASENVHRFASGFRGVSGQGESEVPGRPDAGAAGGGGAQDGRKDRGLAQRAPEETFPVHMDMAEVDTAVDALPPTAASSSLIDKLYERRNALSRYEIGEEGDEEYPPEVRLTADEADMLRKGLRGMSSDTAIAMLEGLDIEAPPQRAPAEIPEAENPGIPEYDADEVGLHTFKRAGGSNGAMFATAADGKPWLVKAYRGDADRVGTELLANALYRELGIRVPEAGKFAGEADWASVADEDIHEPPLPPLPDRFPGPPPKGKKGKGMVKGIKGLKSLFGPDEFESGKGYSTASSKKDQSTGMIVVEPDGRLWVYEPKGKYGGYANTFSKGRLEDGLTPQQNARKELFEEMGIRANPVAVLGDYEGDETMTRFYVARRTAEPGKPIDDETAPDGVKLLSPQEAMEALNRERDQEVLSDVLTKDWPEGSAEDKVPAAGEAPRLAYPLVDGKTKRWKGEDQELGEGFMADALLGNWDVVGLDQDNVLWDKAGSPIRVDQGGTLEFRAMGGPKPFGPVPTEVWTLRSPKGQAAGRMLITDEMMRDQAQDIADRLTPERIDALVDDAPLADEDMRERVRTNLKARVSFMKGVADGSEELPGPADHGEANAMHAADARKLEPITPEEEAAVAAMATEVGDDVQRHLRSKGKKKDADPEVAATIKALDGLVDSARTSEDSFAYMPVSVEALGAKDAGELAGKRFRENGYLEASTDPEEAYTGSALVRILVPEGSSVFGAGAAGLSTEPGAVIFRRGTEIRIAGAREEDGRLVIEAISK